MVRKILSKTEIPMASAVKILENSGSELNVLQSRVLSYAKKYAKLTPEQAELLVEKLVNDIGLTRREAVQIADTCPTNVEELRAVMSGYKRLVSFLLFSEEKMKAVVSLVEDALNNRLK
jgi:DNA-directed RNA polymerase subunit F